MGKLFQSLVLIAYFWSGTAFSSTPWDTPDASHAPLSASPSELVRIAGRYENAEGVARDPGKALDLYCEAARHDFAEAQFRLGWMYANGRGVLKDEAVASALFKLAADQGHEYAARMLRFVPSTRSARLPICLLPDPPVEIAMNGVAGEYGSLNPGDRVLLIAPQVASDEPAEAIEGPSAPRNEIEQLVYRLAPLYAVDPKLALAVISVESAFNASAVSPKNAQGLMQLIPETAERFGVKKVFVPAENIRGGLAYLRWLLAFFQGDVTLVAAAYNAGERAVERYRGIPPYPETRNYVRKISSLYRRANHPYQSEVVEPSAIMRQGRGGSG
ncbi:MAG: transglycosylase SLT domain-containing protein [Burkholderiales bacterium]|nr:transglycosylase SLT domain-containing protein [Burkholderiales bacterium]